jgi:hypothetical protein
MKKRTPETLWKPQPSAETVKPDTLTDRTEFVLQARPPGSRSWTDVNKYSTANGVRYALRKFHEPTKRPEQTRMIKRYMQEWEIKP